MVRFLVALALAGGCSRTEIVLGLVTDLKAPGALDEVMLQVYRGGKTDPMQAADLEHRWMIPGVAGVPYVLPGSFGLASSDGSEPHIEVVLTGFRASAPQVVRKSTLTLVHAKTLFMRMGLVFGCVSRSDCAGGQTCIEGSCRDQIVDPSTLPPFQPDLVDHVACASASSASLLHTDDGTPLATSGDGKCAGECREGACYQPAMAASADGGSGLPDAVAPAWMPIASPFGPGAIHALWATTASGYDVFAVGDNGIVLHRAGGPTGSWTIETAPGVTAALRAIGGDAPTNVWAVGDGATILHRDAIGWHAIASPVAGASLTGVAPAKGGRALAVGSTMTGQPLLLQLAATTAAQVNGFKGTQALTAVASASAGFVITDADPGGGVWFAPAGTLNFASLGTAGARLHGAWLDGSGTGFAVGDNAVVARIGSSAITSATIGAPVTLQAVWGSSPNDVYAVGLGGTIFHFDGTNWSPQMSNTMVDLGAVFGTGSTDVYAGGPMGTLLRSGN